MSTPFKENIRRRLAGDDALKAKKRKTRGDKTHIALAIIGLIRTAEGWSEESLMPEADHTDLEAVVRALEVAEHHALRVLSRYVDRNAIEWVACNADRLAELEVSRGS